MPETLCWFYFAGLVTTASHGVLTAALARALGAEPTGVWFFVGPKLAAWRVAGLEVRLGALPIPASAITFAASADGELRAFDLLPRWRRVLVIALPWLVLIVLGGLALGLDRALLAVASAGPQLVGGAVDPLGLGARLLTRLPHKLAALGPVARVTWLGAKVTGFNLLPIPGLAGFEVLWQLARARGAPPSLRVLAVGSLVTLALGLGWVAALVSSVWK